MVSGSGSDDWGHLAMVVDETTSHSRSKQPVEVRGSSTGASKSTIRRSDRDALRLAHSQTFLVSENSDDMHAMLDRLKDGVKAGTDTCGERYVIRSSNKVRMVWSVFIVILLVYTGTIFLYRLAFLDFRVSIEPYVFEPGIGWQIVDIVVYVAFWIDLAAHFFFSYEDAAGHEITNLRSVVVHYLTTYFIIDLFACLPEEAFAWMFTSESALSPAQSVKAIRLQRLSRLFRLVRLTRILKTMKGPFWRWFSQQRGFLVINLTCGLIWIVHIFACGWYLCAALHNDPEDTWVARRFIVLQTETETTLEDAGPATQWATAMYFTLTVFTTVGFGDISAMTVGEIVYVCFMMLVGVVVNSIIISAVISVVTSSDQVEQFVRKNCNLIQAFAHHTEITDGAVHEMKLWVSTSAKFWLEHQFDRDEMRELIVGKIMPPHLLARLPAELFGGKVLRNRFFSSAHAGFVLPPRLPLLLSLTMEKVYFQAEEVVYKADEYAFNMFLVMSGTFAYVGTPSPFGGTCSPNFLASRPSTSLLGGDMLAVRARAVCNTDTVSSPYRLFGCNSYFGDVEVFMNISRAATARCETPVGQLLMLHKTDLRDLLGEFPQFVVKWKVDARRREQGRIRQLQRLTAKQSFKEFACTQIARGWRRYKTTGDTGRALERVIPSAKMKPLASNRLENGMHTFSSLATTQERLAHDVRSLSKKVDKILEVMSGKMSTPSVFGL